MNINKTFTYFILTLVGFLSSCILDNGESNFIDIDKTPDPVYISNLSYSYDRDKFYPVKDTVWVEEVVYLKLDGEDVYGYEVLLNGESILSNNYNSDFKIEKGNRDSGAYRLIVIQKVKSGTGSIADKIGREYVAYQKELVLMIGPNLFEPEITSIVLRDGTVEVNWKPYTRQDFQSYEILKYGDFFFNPYRRFLISDQNQTTFNDTTYVGDEVYYELRINYGGEYLTSKKFTVFFRYNPEMELEKIGEGKLRLSWKPPLFYKNVKYYGVRESFAQGSGIINDHIPPDVFYTEFEGSTVFGEEHGYHLILNAKVEEVVENRPDRVDISSSVTIGKKIPIYESILYVNSEKAFYLNHSQYHLNDWPDGIYKLDNNTLEVLDSTKFRDIDGYLILSPDGKNLHLIQRDYIKAIEQNDLSVIESFYTGEFLNSNTLPDNFSVSNNNFIVIQNSSSDVIVIDFLTKDILLKTKFKGASHISFDGKHFINGSDIYSFTETGFVLSGILPYSEIEYVRFLNNENEIFVATSDKVFRYDLQLKTQNLSAEFITPSNHRGIHFDHYSLIYAVRQDREMNFINIYTKEKFTREVNFYGNYILEGNILFRNSGHGLKNY